MLVPFCHPEEEGWNMPTRDHCMFEALTGVLPYGEAPEAALRGGIAGVEVGLD